MSDWFSNSSSAEIPDEMWKAAAPMQRQADAVVLWAEMTGKHAAHCGSHGPAPKPKKKTVKKASVEKVARSERFVNTLHAIRNNPEIAGAVVGAPIGAAKNYSQYRERKSGISKAEANLRGKIEEARAMKADKKKIDKLRKKLESAKSRRENIGKTVATGAGIGGTAGAGMMHMAARQRGLRGK